MTEQEFDQRIEEIQRDLKELFESLLGQLHTTDKKTNENVTYNYHLGKLVIKVAKNITEIETGIKNYSRPADWNLIQEGITKCQL